MKPTCFMCKNKRPKKLTAKEGDRVYINAENVIMFCSMRCAANYGLLWGVPEIESNYHFCPVTNEWEMVGKRECNQCGEDQS